MDYSNSWPFHQRQLYLSIDFAGDHNFLAVRRVQPYIQYAGILKYPMRVAVGLSSIFLGLDVLESMEKICFPGFSISLLDACPLVDIEVF